MTKEEFLDGLQQRQRPLLGDEGCRRIRESVVGLAGLGGGGGLTLELIARAGVSKFRLLDRDCFELSNLNRQALATYDSIGRPKVDVAVERLKAINPYVEVEKTFRESVSVANLEELLDGADIGMVCTDSPSSHVLFEQVARRKRLRLIYGWTNGMGCGVWTMPFDKLDESKGGLKRLMGRLTGSKPYTEMPEAEALALDVPPTDPNEFTPTIGFSPNLSACLAASLAIKFLAGLDDTDVAVNMSFDSYGMRIPVRHRLSTMFGKLFG